MKLLIAFATLSLTSGCLVEEHRNCARGERWDGHHCMADRAHEEHRDHDRDRDRDHDHDHDRDHHEGEGGVEVR